MIWIRREITTFEQARTAISFFDKEKMHIVGLDLETTGLDLNKDKMFVFTFGFFYPDEKRGYVFSIWIDEKRPFSQREWIKEIYEKVFKQTKYVFAHNAKYDFHILKNSGFPYEGGNIACSKLLAKHALPLLEFKELSLKPLAKRFLGENRVKSSEKLHERLNELTKEWEKKKEVFNLTGIGTLEEFLKLNPKPGFHHLPKEIIAPYAYEDVEIMLELIPIFIKHVLQLKQFMIVREEWELIPVLIDMEKKGYRRKSGGKTYFVFDQISCKTGRVLSGFQTTSREKRHQYIAPSDFALVIFDYNQIEFRLLAEFMLREQKQRPFSFLVESFLTNETFDIHSTLANWLEKQSTTPNLRQLCKIVNHAILYGSSLQGLLRHKSLAKIDKNLISIIYNLFNEKLSGIKLWKDKIDNDITNQNFITNLYGLKFYAKSPNYKLHNYLIQSSCASLLKEKLVRINKYLKKGNFKSYIQFIIHDEIQFCIHKEEKFLIGVIRAILEQNTLAIPLKVNVNYGKSWGKLKLWKGGE